VTRLRSLLLAWLLIPSLVLWALAFAVGYWRSLAQAHEAYDRTLLGSALVIGERLEFVDGRVTADLPYSALEMLRTDSQDRIFYRVSDRSSSRHITGYEDLPPPSASTAGRTSARWPCRTRWSMPAARGSCWCRWPRRWMRGASSLAAWSSNRRRCNCC
jgi:two-component system sensor histidine kinase TctE